MDSGSAGFGAEPHWWCCDWPLSARKVHHAAEARHALLEGFVAIAVGFRISFVALLKCLRILAEEFG